MENSTFELHIYILLLRFAGGGAVAGTGRYTQKQTKSELPLNGVLVVYRVVGLGGSTLLYSLSTLSSP